VFDASTECVGRNDQLIVRGYNSWAPYAQAMDDRVRELCAKAVGSQDPAELGKIFGQLRAAIHEHTERLRSSVVNFPKSQRRAAS
jgi:hypothetical protein